MSETEYTRRDLDQALNAHLRSDWFYVTIRLVTLVVVFGFIARAIVKFELPAGLVVIPIVIEYLAVVWLGYILSRSVIACPAFRAQAGSLKIALFLSLLVALAVLIALAAEDGSFSITRIPGEWAISWRILVESGLFWGACAGAVGLMAATLPDVARWRRVGGKFVWGGNIQNSMRFAIIVIAIFPVMFLGAWLDEQLGSWSEGERLAWVVMGCLLCIELLSLVASVSMHRDRSPSSN